MQGPESSAKSSRSDPPHMAAQVRDWPAYFDRMEGKPPRHTLVRAMENFDTKASPDDPAPRFAIDLGCGAGRDTQLLLERGWSVLAIDGHAQAIARLHARPVCATAGARLTTRVETFEQADLPPCDLLNASFALPFCPPGAFGALWQKINASIRPGGRFSGQFFGDRDSWSILEDRTHLTRDQVIALFDGFVLEMLEEEDRPSAHAGEAHKHWHVFHIVARKR